MRNQTFDFNATTTSVLEGLDLTGKTVIVTGSTGGMGYEIARALSLKGADVTVIGRTEEKVKMAVDKLTAETGNSFDYGVLELNKFDTIKDFCEEWLEKHDKLDILINNAGIMCTPFELTKEGYEMQFATNHLGHFLLSNLLTEALIKAAPSRVVSVASSAHFLCSVNFEDFHFKNRPYSPVQSYGQSKTANIWFASEYNRRFASKGVKAFSLHPGGVQTNLSRHMNEEVMSELMDEIKKLKKSEGYKTVEQGAATACYAATAPELNDKGGEYLVNSHIATLGEYTNENHAAHAYDKEGECKLWDISNELLGTTF